MKKILVSACLLGCPCRYDAKSCGNQEVLDLANDVILIPVCPEQMGGLPTPRIPAEIVGDKIINRDGMDVTKEYELGADMALKIAQLNHVSYALLKQKSPSCGSNMIYDGTFTGHLIEGKGITTKRLEEHNITVFSEDTLDELKATLTKKGTTV